MSEPSRMCEIQTNGGRQLTVQGKLGTGSYGDVYKAILYRASTTPNVAERVAVKWGRGPKTPKGEAALSREYRLVRSCAHPNIVKVVEWFDAADFQLHMGTPFVVRGSAIAFERAACSVWDMMVKARASTPANGGSASTPVSPCLAVSWAADVGSALSYLHGRRIIHRDVKPANLLIFWDPTDAMGRGYVQTTAKLADFGLARAMPESDPSLKKRRLMSKQPPRCDQHSMTAAVCTAYYRAPEVFAYSGGVNTLEWYADDDDDDLGMCTYGPQVDVWSYGSVVYELLMGRPLARGESGTAVAACWMDVLGPPCADTDYAQLPRWQEIVRVGSMARGRRPPLGQSPGEDVVRACLAWHPLRRSSMDRVCRMPWFTPAGGGTSQQPSHDARCASTPTEPRQRDVQAPSGRSLARTCSSPVEAPASASTPGVCAWGAAVTRALGERCPRAPARARTRGRPQTCQCSGNCRTARHRKIGKGCCDRPVDLEAKYCWECECCVPGCRSPKGHAADHCHRHARGLRDAPLAVALAAAAAPIAARLVPADVIDFLTYEEEMRHDLAASIVVAMLKEPTATREFVTRWRTLPPEYTGDDLHAALTAAIAACVSTPGSAPADPDARASTPSSASADPAARAEKPGSASAHGARHTLEMQQLGRRGVCRFLGSVVVAQHFGVMRKARDGDAHTFVAGLQNSEYVWVSDTGICSKFLEAVREADPASAPRKRPPCFDAGGTPSATDLVEYAGAWREFLTRVGQAAPTLKMRGSGNYVFDSVVRKHVLACAHGVNWGGATSAVLRRLSVDQCEFLATLPEHWAPCHVSSMICGRPDWPLLTSMFMCLWHDVADEVPDALTILTKALRSGCAAWAIEAFERRHGTPPHPYTLMMMLGDSQSPWQMKMLNEGMLTPN